ncbi:Hydroxyacylglutathione hydrolase [bioreactor metagenome]|uniref:Hydroxyacylglutathione hydrolase n=1 Tax=bioreactor metagenome TaxID=1076179 RepID=A0A644XV53_9ZZZZ
MPEEILPNLFRIRVPLIGNPLRELNSYLIRGDGRNLLIDTGFRQDPCRQALLAGLKDLGVRREDTDILLTHLHSDHSGLGPEFVGEGREIYIGERDLPWMCSDTRNELWKHSDIAYRLAGFPVTILFEADRSNPARSMAPAPDFTRYHPIKNGEVLQVGGYRLKAVLTPGHTPGHLCFWLEEQGVMFTGDHVLFDITPNITAWMGVPDSLGDYLASLRAISRFDVKLTLPAHRESGELKPRIESLLRHHEIRLNEALSVVKNNPGFTAVEIGGKMTWKIHADSWETFPLTQKWFAVGECMSHLDHLIALGKVRREVSGEVYRYYAV